MRDWRRAAWIYGAILLGHALLNLVMTYPVGVELGTYHPYSGARLSLTGCRGPKQQPDRFILTEIVEVR